ncbi:MAG: alpha/beta hydrolase [Muribaculaceae bacterium]|nr:alpha/beta hydrolase [Muribaculaceae bacterium]
MKESIDIDGNLLSYDREGTGSRAVIVMHGWGCNSSTVKVLADACIDSTTTVYNIDLPGFGVSSEPKEPWGVYEYADIIEKFVRLKNISAPVLIGHSYGGRIAIVYASRNKVDRLILVDSAGIKPRRKLKYYFKVYSFKLAKFLAPIILGRTRGEAAIERMRGRSGSQDYQNSSPMMRRVMSVSVNQDLKHHLPDIQAPTLLIWGANDTATPLSDAKTMESLIPDAGLVCYEGAGHYSFLDRPAQTAAVIASFLNFSKK